MENMDSKNLNEVVAFQTSEGFAMAQLQNIVYLKSDGNYSYVFLSNGKKIHLTKQLSELATFLPDVYFIRVHRQYLANKIHVVKYMKKDSQLILSTLDVIPVSVRKKKELSTFFYMLG